MQYYGGPTRVLDWTHSPLVALYFAARFRWDRDGAVWSVQRRMYMAKARDRFGPRGHELREMMLLGCSAF